MRGSDLLSPTVEFFLVLFGYFNEPILGECVHRFWVSDLTELFERDWLMIREPFNADLYAV